MDDEIPVKVNRAKALKENETHTLTLFKFSIGGHESYYTDTKL